MYYFLLLAGSVLAGLVLLVLYRVVALTLRIIREIKICFKRE